MQKNNLTLGSLFDGSGGFFGRNGKNITGT